MFRRKNKVYSGSNVIIVNGKIINGNTSPGEFKKIDEKKTEHADKIDKICVNSTFVDVNFSISNSSEIKAHLYGEGTVSGKINLTSNVFNREMKISIETDGNFSIINGSLKLDISLPRKIFKSLSVTTRSGDIDLNDDISVNSLNITSTSGDIDLNKEISVNSIKITSTSGDLNTYAAFTDGIIRTTSGDIHLFITAKRDIIVNISTTSGDISAEFDNIGHMNLSTNTISGDVRNRHKKEIGYSADVDISTISGDITIF